jgi:hypothetical protein
VLASGDRWVNFVQWFAMLGSLIAVSKIAQQLGADNKGQLFATALGVSLPMGIAQSTSTMTDYVGAFFVVLLALEVIFVINRNRPSISPWFLALPAGHAILVKPTSFAYLLPFGIWLLAIYLKWRVPLTILKQGALAILIVGLINFGYLQRNYQTYGNPIGETSHIHFHSNNLKNVSGLISNTLKNASLHAGTPWEQVNDFIERGIIKAHLIMDLNPSDPRTTAIGEFRILKPDLDEKTAGNAFHAYFFIVSFMLMIITYKRQHPHSISLGLVSIAGFLLLSYLFKWQIFSGRFHLPFFILLVPVIASGYSNLGLTRITSLIGIIFILASAPWLVSLGNRPLIKDIRDPASPSILRGSRESWFFPGSAEADKRIIEITDRISSVNCNDVALLLSGGGAEYVYWAYLGAPRSNLNMQWIISGGYSERYEDPSFEPCAAICEKCPESWTKFRDLPLDYEFGSTKFFLVGKP